MEDNCRDVIEMLEKNDKGALVVSIRTFLKVFENDNYFADVRLDEMRMQAFRVTETGRRVYWEDSDDAKSRLYLEENYGLSNERKMKDAFTVFLEHRKIHPAQELIKSYVWDGQPHCQRFFIDWLDADDTPYTKEATRLLFRQMIGRAFEPGCKADYVVVLKGKQGCAKSTICRWLALEDEMYASVTTISGQKGYEAVQGKFVCELEELLATVGEGTKKDALVKSFISGAADHYRRPYDHRASDNPRTCVFIGTTNQSRFLSDVTGNRRWYPIECHRQDGSFVYEHEDEVKQEIRQCLAEMYNAYLNNLPLALPIPDKLLHDEIEKQQEASEMEDYRIGLIEEYIIEQVRKDPHKEYVYCLEIWTKALQNRRKPSKKESNEIGELLRHKIGCSFTKKNHVTGQGTVHTYYIPDRLRQAALELAAS